ncbi:hypothetical protein DTL42_22100 [Bremerella cremea]|uniref:Leucine-rich repeat domain-containing protein n=1 Tax=Bremerella cremea TaxID=1031537 RepID=A0A368KN52_9BACT|nr:hypothetical protein [Bremerella cremea]RCS41262.1 hypothetical protein DTL42_22100 [Bremerella cremea]
MMNTFTLPGYCCFFSVLFAVPLLQAEERKYESPEIRQAILHLQGNGARVHFNMPRTGAFRPANAQREKEYSVPYTVNLYEMKATAENLSALLVLPQVERLYLSNEFDRSDRTWKTLSQFGELQHLSIMDSLKNEDIEHIAEFSNLQSLEIRLGDVDSSYLWYLEELRNLQRLSIHVDGDDEASFTSLPNMPKLSQLILHLHGTKPVSLDGIENLKELRSLNVNARAIQGSELKGIAKLSHLQLLTLANAEFAASDLEMMFQQLKGLEYLNFTNCKLGTNDLSALKNLSKLQRLQVYNTPIDDDSLATLVDLPELNYMYVRGSDITDDGLKHLAKMPKLNRVYLYHTKVTPEGVKWINEQRPKMKVSAPVQNN